jgi:prepilin-type N-terminal cleavage/methylation domain-containing protein
MLERCLGPEQNEEEGFTLIELVISVAILAIALTGLVTTLYRSIQLDNSFKNRSIALQGAQKMMSQVKAQPRRNNGEELKEFIENIDNDPDDSVNEYDVTGLEPDVTAEGRVTYEDKGGYIRVDIVVEWNDQMGQQDVAITGNFYTYNKS